MLLIKKIYNKNTEIGQKTIFNHISFTNGGEKNAKQ